jgi:hypothetical protein
MLVSCAGRASQLVISVRKLLVRSPKLEICPFNEMSPERSRVHAPDGRILEIRAGMRSLRATHTAAYTYQ